MHTAPTTQSHLHIKPHVGAQLGFPAPAVAQRPPDASAADRCSPTLFPQIHLSTTVSTPEPSTSSPQQTDKQSMTNRLDGSRSPSGRAGTGGGWSPYVERLSTLRIIEAWKMNESSWKHQVAVPPRCAGFVVMGPDLVVARCPAAGLSDDPIHTSLISQRRGDGVNASRDCPPLARPHRS
ncbi:hypothetical protein HETIRDRAFT_103387 [Heterobasidion irregulare TC 32-1]|uniref:Uncharacterized protein n=1 Tax=Heterobasidion irregulare (strain TC 32-1) TaxID=747525 RepID=W4K4V5_HETIT|nr:uncharacterized protein HETIRDRAFT_103387 [Heterobasidion irregulare TC 32-1]ETW80091.1 hypothetical protein HETIRDRAFT_103387 [Heterobasidion irregulare TC 32-1]